MIKLYCYVSKKYKITAYSDDKHLMKQFIKQIDGDYVCQKLKISDDEYTDHYDYIQNRKLYECYGAILTMELEEFLEEKANDMEGQLIGCMYAIDDLLSFYKFNDSETKEIEYFRELYTGYIETSGNGIRSLSLLENVEYTVLLKRFLNEIART